MSSFSLLESPSPVKEAPSLEGPSYWRSNAVSTLPEYANAEQVRKQTMGCSCMGWPLACALCDFCSALLSLSERAFAFHAHAT